MLNASHSQMKRAALSALSTNSTPPRTIELFATMPTGRPSMRPNPVTTSAANSGLISKNESASTSPSMTSCMSNGTDSSAGTQSARELDRRRLGGDLGRRLAPARRQVGEVQPGLLDGVLVVDGEVVAAAGDGGVHARAAHLLQRHLLADDHLGHPRRAEVHRGVALDHDHDVAERRDVRAAGGGRAEQAADLRHLARQRDLVVEDAPGAAAAGEQRDLVGDARPGGVDEPEDRQLLGERPLGDADDLLDGARAPRAGLDRRVVRDDERGTSVDQALAGDHAVGRQPGAPARWPAGRPRRRCPSSNSSAMRSRT